MTLNSESDGSGSVEVRVRLDDEAMAAVPDLAEQLRTEDLEAAGWSISGPDRQDGKTVIVARHGFSSDEEAEELLRQVGGPDGPLRDLSLNSERSALRVNTTFSGTVDLSRGIESFGDTVLQERFGRPLAIDPAETSRSLDFDWAETFPFEVVVHLPGSQKAISPITDEGVWRIPYGTVTVLSARAEGLNRASIAFFSAALVGVLAAWVIARRWQPARYRWRHASTDGGVRAKDLLAAKESERMKDLDESRLVFNEAGAARTADVLAFAPGSDGGWKVLLIERRGDPFAGRLAMPGGFMDKEPLERAGEAAARELNEETGLALRPPPEEEDEKPPISLETGILGWLGRYDTPGRDPRGPTASDVYVVVLDEEPPVEGADDAARAEFVDVNNLLEQLKSSPGAGGVLAFDHDLALLDALEMLRRFGVTPSP